MRSKSLLAIHEEHRSSRVATFSQAPVTKLSGGAVDTLRQAATPSRDVGNIFIADAPIAIPVRPQQTVISGMPMSRLADDLLCDSQQQLPHAAKVPLLTCMEVDCVAKRVSIPRNFADVMGFAPKANTVLDLEETYDLLIAHVLPNDRERVLVATQAFLTGCSDGRIDYSVTGDDGIERRIESTWVVIMGADGLPAKAFSTIMDISERVMAELALCETDTRYRNLFNSIDQGIGVIERIVSPQGKPVDYRFIEVNPSFEKHTGLKNATGQRIRELVPAIKAHWWERLDEVASSGGPVRFTHETNSAGDRYWLDIYAFRLGGPASRQILIVFTDATKRKRAEEARRVSEEQFRATFQNAPIGIAHVGIDGRWLRVNPALCRLTGYSADELTSKSVAEITCPDDVAQTLEKTRELLAGETTTTTIEKRYIHKTGRYVMARVTVLLLRDAAGLPMYFIGVIEDISERKATLEALEQKTRFVERLTHIVPNTMHVFDLVAKRNLWVNRHLGSTLGYPAQDIEKMGALFLQLTLHPEDVARMATHRHRVCSSHDNEVVEFEYRMRNHDGQWRWLLQSDTPFRRNAAGQVIEMVGTATDVTERKLIKADLKTALSVAETANRAKSDFLSSMSHELRSPLNAVLGFAQLLESGSPPPTPLQRESLNHILKAGWYLLDLINEILDLTLIESGHLSFTPEDVSLAEVLNDCHAMVELQAQKCGIRLTFASPDGACLVRADRTRLQQIFINLLSNAIKYNRPGGVVRVNCAVQATGRMRISFEDSGAGLTPDQVKRLFQPFDRLGQKGGMIEGTGIGLVVSKRLVELMGGHIGARSTLGIGSVFWVDLIPIGPRPVVDTIASTSPLPKPVACGTRPFTILCVEDDPANLMLVQRILERRADVRLLMASNANRGVAIARATRPDVILMDISLPGISGLESLELLSQDAATALIPVIAISANAMHDDIEYGMKAGFFRYLTKPLKITLLTEALDAALTRPGKREARTLVQVESS